QCEVPHIPPLTCEAALVTGWRMSGLLIPRCWKRVKDNFTGKGWSFTDTGRRIEESKKTGFRLWALGFRQVICVLPKAQRLKPASLGPLWQPEDVVALRARVGRHPRDDARVRFLARAAEESHVLLAAGFVDRRDAGEVGAHRLLPQNLSGVLVERAHRAIGERRDEDQAARGDDGPVAVNTVVVAGVGNPFVRQRGHRAEGRLPFDRAAIEIVRRE